MRKSLLTLSSVFFLTTFTYAQSDPPLKELHQTLKKAKSDTLKIATQLKLGNYHYEKSASGDATVSLDSSSTYILKAMDLSRAINDKHLLAKSYIALSKTQMRQRKVEQAHENAQKAVDLLSGTSHKSELAKAYRALAGSNSISKIADIIASYEKALAIYKETGQVKEQAELYNEIGYMHMGQGKMQLGQEDLNESLRLYKSIGFKDTQRIYSLIGIAYNELGDFNKALEYGLTAVKIAEERDPDGYGNPEIYNYLAKTYNDMKDYKNASLYFNKAYILLQKYNNPQLKIMIENNLVLSYLNSGKNKEALAILKKMEERIQSTNLTGKVMILSKALVAYTRTGDFKNADRYAKEVTAVLDSGQSYDYLNTMLYPALIEYYYKGKKYDETRKYADIYLKISEKNKNLVEIKDLHRTLFRLDSIERNFDSAVKHLQLEKKYNDSLYSIERNKQLAELQIKYDTEKKDKDIIIKEQANKVLAKQAQLIQGQYTNEKNLRNFSLAVALLLIIISLLLYSRYRSKKRINEVLVGQKNEINHKNSLLQKLVGEKEWLLKEVHHRVKNNLQMVISLLNTQSYYLKDNAALDANRDNQNRIQSMSLIHKKLYQTENIVTINMKTYIDELVEHFKVSYSTGERIRFELDCDPIELDSVQAIPLGLIINEVITNAIKHAFPQGREGTIWIALDKLSPERLALRIKDNGVGISRDSSIKDLPSFGMSLINGLSGDLHAELEINTGTGVEVLLTCDILDQAALKINTAS